MTTLNAVTLVDPFEISIDSNVLGSTKRSANGTVLTDYITSILQKKISISWRLLDSTQRDTIVTQCQNAVTAARTLVLPDGRSISVIFPADASVTETEVRVPWGWAYNIQAVFLENLRLA